MIKPETYTAIALSTSHVCNKGLRFLNAAARNQNDNMIISRETGFLIKLCSDKSQFESRVWTLPDSVNAIIELAYNCNARLIELDRDADVLDDFPVYTQTETPAISTLQCQLTDVYDESSITVDAKVEASAQGITITLDGQDTMSGSEPILIELARDNVMLHLWNDPDIEEPTHSISLQNLQAG